MLLLAIARECGDEVEKCERAGAFGIPWQRKRWSSLTSLQSFYNDAVRRSFLEQFRGRSQCSRCSSRIVCFDSPVTTARRGDSRIGKPMDPLTLPFAPLFRALTLHDLVSAVLAIHRRSPLPKQGTNVHRHRNPERQKMEIVWIRLLLPLSIMSVGSQDSMVGEEA